MNILRKHLKLLALFFVITFLLQSCVVYQKTPVSLEQASKQVLKAKVKTINNETYQLHRIEFENGKFYGVQKVKGKKVRITLNTNEFSKIKLQDKTMSTILSIVLPFSSNLGIF